jgi:hypothetical protein
MGGGERLGGGRGGSTPKYLGIGLAAAAAALGAPALAVTLTATAGRGKEAGDWQAVANAIDQALR